MAIYNIFDFYEKIHSDKMFHEEGPKIDPGAFKTNQIDENFIPSSDSSKDRIFSTIVARLFFFILLVADILWGLYSLIACFVKFLFCLISLFRISPLRKSFLRSCLSFKRALVCGLALMIALFSPALGIMFSCMYFLMYDKAGIDEVVPSSLKEQFKGVFP